MSTRYRANRNPLREVVSATLATTYTNNGYGRGGEHEDWTLTLACGHREYRYAGPHADEDHPPLRARCSACGKTPRED